MTKKPPAKAAKKATNPEQDTCKECKRLKGTIAKMTNSKHGKPARQLYFDENWVATRWGVSSKLLQKLRYSGGGPKVSNLGGRMVRYRLRDITDYECANTFNSRSEKDVKDSGKS